MTDIDDRFALTPPRAGGNHREYSIHVSAAREIGHITFGVEHVFQCPWTDLALLCLRALNQESFDYPVVQPTLEFRPPGVGAEVFIFGYPDQTAQLVDGFIAWESRPFASTGRVQQYWANQRDAAMLNFPSFEVGALTHGHMSGSPIATAEGYIVGVFVANLDNPEEAPPISYGVPLWPLLGTLIFDPLNGEPSDTYSFLDLYRENRLPGLNWNHPHYDRRDPLFLTAVPNPHPLNQGNRAHDQEMG